MNYLCYTKVNSVVLRLKESSQATQKLPFVC